MHRWSVKPSRNVNINSVMWSDTLNTRRTTTVNTWSCGTNCRDVRLLVPLRKRKTRTRQRTLLSLGCLVLKTLSIFLYNVLFLYVVMVLLAVV